MNRSPYLRTFRSPALWLCVVLCLSYCAQAPPEGRLIIDLGKTSADRLLHFYFGSYASAEGSNPFAAGLLERDGSTVYLNVAALQAVHPTATPDDPNEDGTLEWEELVPFFQTTYYAARNIPPTLAAFQQRVAYGSDGWYTVELIGVMTTARRIIYIEESAIRAALEGYRSAGDKLMYPTGTTIVCEHRRDDVVVETTVMQKRTDGYWDFYTYGSNGHLAATTQPAPRALKSPVQCVGCHLGKRQFEPAKSFPNLAPDGPHGPRTMFVEDGLRNADVASFFDEHRKRSDTVLGLYNTLFVSGLMRDRARGTLSDADAALLDKIGIPSR